MGSLGFPGSEGLTQNKQEGFEYVLWVTHCQRMGHHLLTHTILSNIRNFYSFWKEK